MERYLYICFVTLTLKRNETMKNGQELISYEEFVNSDNLLPECTLDIMMMTLRSTVVFLLIGHIIL